MNSKNTKELEVLFSHIPYKSVQDNINELANEKGYMYKSGDKHWSHLANYYRSGRNIKNAKDPLVKQIVNQLKDYGEVQFIAELDNPDSELVTITIKNKKDLMLTDSEIQFKEASFFAGMVKKLAKLKYEFNFSNGFIDMSGQDNPDNVCPAMVTYYLTVPREIFGK